MAAEDASFSTVMLAMSFGFRKLSGSRPAESPPPAPVPTGIPSITYSGSLLALTEVAPRIRIERPPPGSLLSRTWTPATLLSMSALGLTTAPGLKSCTESCVTAPVMSPARCEP